MISRASASSSFSSYLTHPGFPAYHPSLAPRLSSDMSLPLSNVCVAANAADRFNYYLLDGSEDALSSSDTPPSSSEYREFDAHSKLDGFPGSSTSAPPSAPGTGLSSDDVRYPSPPPSPPISSDGSSGSTIYSDALSTLDGSLGVSAISARLSTPGAGLSSYDIRCPLPPSPPISTDGPSGSSIYCDAFSTLGGSPSSSAYSSHSLTHGAGLPSDGAHHPPDGFPSSSARSVRPSMPEKGPPPDDVDSLSPPSLLHLLPFLFDDPSSSSEYSSYPSTAEKDPPSDDFRRPPSPISLPPWPPFSFDSSSGSSEHSSHHSTPGQGPPSDGINRPPSPPSLVPLHSFVLPRSASTSWTLNRSIEYSLSPGPDKSLQLRAKSAVSDKVPTPSLLTEEILAIGDDALSGYEAVRMQCPPEVASSATFESPRQF